MVTFNQEHISKKISDSRKVNNLTQVELADLLNVSYQAVSNWERGQSMPDIEKLCDLSHILKISLDELLNSSYTAENVRMIQETGTEVLDEAFIIDAAALVKPKKLTKIVEQFVFSANALVKLAPFVDTSLIVEKLEAISERLTIQDWIALAPFLKREEIDALFKPGILNRSSIATTDILALSPFLTSVKIKQMLDILIDCKSLNLEDIHDFIPFLASDDLTNILQKFQPTK